MAKFITIRYPDHFTAEKTREIEIPDDVDDVEGWVEQNTVGILQDYKKDLENRIFSAASELQELRKWTEEFKTKKSKEA
jgi:hypothetical protein